MPESQRLETLDSLLQSEYPCALCQGRQPMRNHAPLPSTPLLGSPVGQRQLLRELILLPAGADSLRARGHRAELEQKLVQVEEAIKIFSQAKVFVKMDS